MNYCRSCKHWGLNAHYVGAGVCTNLNVQLRVVVSPTKPFITAQNFGCVLHEEGPMEACCFTDENIKTELTEFLNSLPKTQ